MSQQTALSAAIASTGATSITVDDYLGFPSVAFSILIDAEVLRVTAGFSTTTWTVTRGYSGTTAATHTDNSTVTYLPEIYGEVADLSAMLATDTSDRIGLLYDILAGVRGDIDASTMRTFLPLAADVTVTCDIWNAGCSLLTEAMGGFTTAEGRTLDIASITTVEVREPGGSYVTVAAGDTGYYLEPGPAGTGVAGTDWPYEDISLSPLGAYPHWPTGKRAARLVGKIGAFPSVPVSVARGSLSEGRERFRQSIGGGAGPTQLGVNTFGVPIFVAGDSPDVRRILRHPFSRRPGAA